MRGGRKFEETLHGMRVESATRPPNGVGPGALSDDEIIGRTCYLIFIPIAYISTGGYATTPTVTSGSKGTSYGLNSQADRQSQLDRPSRDGADYIRYSGLLNPLNS